MRRLVAFAWVIPVVALCGGCAINGGMGVSLSVLPIKATVGESVTLTITATNAAGCDLTGVENTDFLGVLVLPFIEEGTPDLNLACSGQIAPEMYGQVQAAMDSVTSQFELLSHSLAQPPQGQLLCEPISSPFPESQVCALPLTGLLHNGDTAQGTVVVKAPTYGSFRSLVWVAGRAVIPSQCIQVVQNDSGIAAGVSCAALSVGGGAAPAVSTVGLAALVAMLGGIGLLAARRLAR
ncbi:MAG: hypothetical protein ACHQ9S_14870 [Candidatus Binatia bacterium]